MHLALAILIATLPLTTASAQPVEVAHRWGVTRIAAPPERIVSLSFTGADALLALGIVPVAYRAWYGGDAITGLWPWAAERLGPARPTVLRGEIDPEAVARLEPDLIEAMSSGLTHADYVALSRIAPVLGPPEGAGDFGATWDRMLTDIGHATGRDGRARGGIADLEGRIESLRTTHPGWQGATAVIAWPDGPLIYGTGDPRVALLGRLGFHLPEKTERLTRGGFFVRLDPEMTAPLEADVVIWIDVGGGVGAVRDMPLRGTMRSVAEGREIVADTDLAAALSYASPLSLPYALDRLAPKLDAALDGDPETPVPGAAQAGLLP